MQVGSLFSGCAGTALGFKRAGFEHPWFVENNEYAQATLRKNFPEATIYGDIKEIDFRTVQKVHVLEGGFPCQDISNAGKRTGITGSRSSLWKHFARAISELQPQVVSIENVSALTRRGLDTVLCDLAALGYDAEWHCIPASAIGAPHRRDRIFIIAYPNNGQQLGTNEQLQTRGNTFDSSIQELGYTEYSRQPSTEECSSSVQRSNTSKTEQKQTSELTRPSNEYDELADTNNSRCFHGSTKEHAAVRDNEALVVSGSSSFENDGFGWWATEPDVGRVANGVPSRVDRIKCLGNAVVPQNAEVIAKAIRKYLIEDIK